MFQIINWQLTIIFIAMLYAVIIIYFYLLRREIKYKILMEWKTTPKEELKTKLNEIIPYTFSILIMVYLAVFFGYFYFAIVFVVALILILGLILHPKHYAICEEGIFIHGILRKWKEFSYYKVKGNKIHLIGKYLFSVSIENREGVEKVVVEYLKEKK